MIFVLHDLIETKSNQSIVGQIRGLLNVIRKKSSCDRQRMIYKKISEKYQGKRKIGANERIGC